MNSYQQSEIFNKKRIPKKEEFVFDNMDSGKAGSTSYTPIGERPSFDNPIYESSPTSEPSILSADTKDPLYQDIKLDLDEVQKLKSMNPYEFD